MHRAEQRNETVHAIGATSGNGPPLVCRMVLTRAVGIQPLVQVDTLEEAIRDGDRFVLCSDGLSNAVHDSVILKIVLGNDHPDDVVQKLIDEANVNGGQDNITALFVQCGT
jgi:PPM family protein phosphatase